MLKLAAPRTELDFFVRRERDGRFLAVSVGAEAESIVVNAPTLRDLHINLAERVAVNHGPNVHIRLLVSPQILAGARLGPKQAPPITPRRASPRSIGKT
jgi:hypothetical protein